MTPAERRLAAIRKVRQAEHVRHASNEAFALGDALLVECERLIREAEALMEGRDPAPRPRRVLPDLRH